jgi:hypothetical protein
MKISSDAANVSPLDTWLREETSPSTPSSVTDSAAPVTVSAHAPAGLYDSAEGLLNLDVWNGASPETRALTTVSAATRSDARDWAEHVIEPLLR